MIVSLIAALDRRRGIGKDNQLPWRLPADLKRFREITTGHHIITGRKTYESIIAMGGKPLPGRTTIIITRNQGYSAEGCFVVHSLADALALARTRGEQEAFVIGGAEIYAQALPHADRLYLTLVDAEVEADAFFPEFDQSAWQIKESREMAADEKNSLRHTFQILEPAANQSHSPKPYDGNQSPGN